MNEAIAESQLLRFRDDFYLQVQRAYTLQDHSVGNPPRFQLPDWATYGYGGWFKPYATGEAATAGAALNALSKQYNGFVPWEARGQLEAILGRLDSRTGLGSSGGPSTQQLESSGAPVPVSAASGPAWLGFALAAGLAFLVLRRR